MSKKLLLFLACLIASFAITISPLFAEEKPEVFVQMTKKDIMSINILTSGGLK